MNNAPRGEAMSDIGEKLQAALTNANNAVADAMRERDALLDAWSAQDWDWLHRAGYLTAHDLAEIAAERAARGE